MANKQKHFCVPKALYEKLKLAAEAKGQTLAEYLEPARRTLDI